MSGRLRTAFGATVLSVCLSLLLPCAAAAEEIVLEVQPDGAASRVAAPASCSFTLPDSMAEAARDHRLHVTETAPGAAAGPAIPAQFLGAGDTPARGTLVWLMPPVAEGRPAAPRLFRLAARAEKPEAILKAAWDAQRQRVDVSEGQAPVLRYNHGPTEVPQGIGPEFARGDYVSPLYGPDGEVLTEDYPKDHPHHRAVNWSWATVIWKRETRDLFAVRGIWSRPIKVPRLLSGPVLASIEAENEWKWDDKETILRQVVRISAYRQADRGRIVDITVELRPTAGQLELGGRLGAGYSGFNVRMAPGQGQRILMHNDPAGSDPRRSYADYSAEFPGGKGRAGLAILQCRRNPLYPSEWLKYPDLNFFQPAYPGPKAIPLASGESVVLSYRLWIHAGEADEKTLADVWAAYNLPAAAAVKK